MLKNLLASKAYWRVTLKLDGIFAKPHAPLEIFHTLPEAYYLYLLFADDLAICAMMGLVELKWYNNDDFKRWLKDEFEGKPPPPNLEDEGGNGSDHDEPLPVVDAPPDDVLRVAPVAPVINVVPVDVRVTAGSRPVRTYFDNFTGGSGMLRAFAHCPNTGCHSARCRLYRPVQAFPSRRECVAFLAAWAVGGADLTDLDGVRGQERHRLYHPPPELVETALSRA